MDGEKQAVQLRQLLATEKAMTDEKKNKILEILGEFVQKFLEQENDSIALQNTESIGSFDSGEMEDLIDEHPWLLPYRCFLESKYVMEDDYLLKLSQQLDDNSLEANTINKLIEKLIGNQETRINLIKLGGSLMEHVHVFCRNYPSLNSLCSTDWLRVKEQMRDGSWTYNEKQWVSELWCTSTSLRKEIADKYLPLELANDFERIGAREVWDISEEDFLEFSRDFTANEKRKFEKWYRSKESECKTMPSADDEQVELQFTSDENIQFLSSNSSLNEDAVLFESYNHFGELPIDPEEQSMDEINDSIVQFDEFLDSMPEPLEMLDDDQELIANLSEGSALHGYCYGIDDIELCKQAPIAILKKTDLNCAVHKWASTTSLVRSEYFVNSQEKNRLLKTITETGHSFGFGLKSVNSYRSDNNSNRHHKVDVDSSSSSDKTPRKNMTMTTFHIFHVGFSYNTFDAKHQLTLSESALESLQNVKSVARAKKFLQNYGSHLFCGVNHLGGILSHSVEIDISSQLLVDSEQVLKRVASEKMDQAAFLTTEKIHAFDVNDGKDLIQVACRFKIDNFNNGIDEKEPKLFEECLKASSRLWRIIDRENFTESFIPIWNVIYDKHPDMKDEADFLREAWLELAAKPDIGFYLEQERLKTEERQKNLELRQKQAGKVKQIEPVLVFNETQTSYIDPMKTLTSVLQGKESMDEAVNENLSRQLQSSSGMQQYKEISPPHRVNNSTSIIAESKTNQETHNPNNGRKTYAAFLTDRPFNTSSKLKVDNSIHHLLNCLRYRLRLTLDSNGSKEKLLTNELAVANLNSLLDSENVQLSSLYDVLLRFIDDFDASGAVEIFRLLVERRSAIPLFVPASKKHHLNLLSHVTLPGGIRLGQDKSLMRVAVISCRKRDESKTCEILKNLFHVDSVHLHDFNQGCVTSEEFTAEIGCGCLPATEESGLVQHLMVAHIVGDFLPLWPFITQFADYLIVEDIPIGLSPSLGQVANQVASKTNYKQGQTPYVFVWRPSVDDKRCQESTEYGFRHLRLEGQLGGKTYSVLRSIMTVATSEWKSIQPTEERLELRHMTILEDKGYTALNCSTPDEIESSLSKAVPESLGHVKKHVFLLQKNFLDQAKHEEAKCEQRLDKDKVREENAAIKKCREKRRTYANLIQDNPLLDVLFGLLASRDPCERVLSIRALEKSLARRSEMELGSQINQIRELYSSYVEQQSTDDSKKQKEELEAARESLRTARMDYNESAFNIEHLWRELSHLYTSMSHENQAFQQHVSNAPRWAAQHLVDGFCIELLDGDSNLLHIDWVTEVLHELGVLIGQQNKGRIFVLSVMGVQSSGKSTLLNTMFGIQMKTSVGQCTRGVNMQLLKVEGRPEYDYILLLDTEGTRAPEYHDLPGSEKRDNQMATLSILLADATIVVIPGENDAAVKEILPVVLMAYQGSKLAESKGGRLSSMMFFVYNRIDTTQKDKMDNIVRTLGTSLHEAFDHVQKLSGNNSTQLKSESPFRSFKLGAASNPADSDVCILGNVKEKFEPPGDVPDAAYGEALVKFREHIHQRVTNSKDAGATWKGRSIAEFSSYIEDVWKCIGSANFALNFASIVERDAFAKLDAEYKKIEQQLADAYRKVFVIVEREMIKEKSKNMASSLEERNEDVGDKERLDKLECQLKEKILATITRLDEDVDAIVNDKGRDKWIRQFQELWKEFKKDQSRNWQRNLKTSFTTLFKYEHHVENYKKELRREIGEMFKSSNAAEWTDTEKNQKFQEAYKKILNNAQERFPPKNIAEEIKRVYQSSTVILGRAIEIDSQRDKLSCENLIVAQQSKDLRNKGAESKMPWLLSQIKKNFRYVGDIIQNVIHCFDDVYKLINNLVDGKKCYDDSIVSEAMDQTDGKIISNGLSANSHVQIIHTYGRVLITKLMKDIQQKWEADNSVYAKLKQKSTKDAMRQYFLLVSQGLQTTKLFACQMACVLRGAIAEAFEKEMIQRTSNAIRNERWLHDARFMHKHVDLFLANLLQEDKVSEVLEYIRDPQSLYVEVLHRLIASKVPANVDEIWKNFEGYSKRAIKNAVSVSLKAERERAQTFVDELRSEFLKDNSLQSGCLGKAFMVDCQGEYEDCDREEKQVFKKTCVAELTQVFQMKDDILSKSKSQNFAGEFCPKVVDYMKTLNDPGAMPRCDAYCPVCGSMCIEAANHDTKLKPHDAIHQPGGVAGVHYKESGKLDATTCGQSYEDDRSFFMNKDDTVPYSFREFSTIFPGWKDPRFNEELPFREYVFATYNEDIARKYDALPCSEIPHQYFRDLSTIIKQLKRDIQN